MRLCSCYDMHMPAASEASGTSCVCAACLPASAHLVVCPPKEQSIEAHKCGHQAGLGGGVAKGVDLPSHRGYLTESLVEEPARESSHEVLCEALKYLRSRCPAYGD